MTSPGSGWCSRVNWGSRGTGRAVAPRAADQKAAAGAASASGYRSEGHRRGCGACSAWYRHASFRPGPSETPAGQGGSRPAVPGRPGGTGPYHDYQGLPCFSTVPRCRCLARPLNYAAGIIRRHLKAIGSRWRKLNPGQQALLVLAYLRKGETFAQLAAGFGIGRTTAWRYVDETVELLAARAPKLRAAVRDAKRAGHAYVILDGTLIPIDRVAADRPFYSGKHKKHGMNLQVIASPDGDIRVGVRSAARLGPRQESGMDLGRARRTGERAWPARATRAAPGRRSLPGEEQAGAAERGQPRPRETPRPRRAGERAAQDMEDSQQAPLLPWRAGKLAKAIHVLQLREA